MTRVTESGSRVWNSAGDGRGENEFKKVDGSEPRLSKFVISEVRDWFLLNNLDWSRRIGLLLLFKEIPGGISAKRTTEARKFKINVT